LYAGSNTHETPSGYHIETALKLPRARALGYWTRLRIKPTAQGIGGVRSSHGALRRGRSVDNLRVVFGAPESPVFGAIAENAPKFFTNYFINEPVPKLKFLNSLKCKTAAVP
jgi:hypothetical protein